MNRLIPPRFPLFADGPLAPLSRLCCAVLLGLGITYFASADTLPQIQDVVAGAASISSDGSSMRIDTGTPTTVINWKDFSIGPDNRVHFQQPDGSSVTLNRVTGTNASAIYGVLTSNGKLVLLNPNGIWFGPNAKVATSALVAGAGMVTEEQLEQFGRTGKLDIQLKGRVRNEGSITASDHGLVTLLGAQVENAGIIQARKGQVNLATGPSATLDFRGDGLVSLAVGGQAGQAGSVDPTLKGGVHNSGQIEVGSGVVAMSADRAAQHLESVISAGGTVSADSVTEDGGTIVLGNAAHTRVDGHLSAQGQDGGSIKVLGDSVEIADSAVVDASGTGSKGGSVLVGGSFQGQGSEPGSRSTRVEQGAQLRADGVAEGGKVVVWSDGRTHFAGSASAKGSERGGTVETSGSQLSLGEQAHVDVSGKTPGTWLLDPETVEVDAAAANVISDSLTRGNVRIDATQAISINAPIIVSQATDASGNPHTLVLIARGAVGTLTSYAGQDKSNASGSVTISAPILLKDGNLFIDATGDVTLRNTTAGQSGDLAMLGRAIIDLGKGTLWIDTANTASVRQDAGTAVLADKVAVRGASVVMDSALNFAGTLAGAATNGRFVFHQTNATGTTDLGTVVSPYGSVAQAMTGVSVQQVEHLGTRSLHADVNGVADKDVLLTLGGQAFDYLVFEATGYVDKNGQPLSSYTDAAGNSHPIGEYPDSSDFLVKGLTFTDSSGVQWKVVPDKDNPATLARFYKDTGSGFVESSEAPTNFSFDAHQGIAMVAVRNGITYGWGVSGYEIPGAQIHEEIQHDPSGGGSEQLVIALGSSSTEVRTTLAWLQDDKVWDNSVRTPLLENAQVHFLASKDHSASADLAAHKANLDIQVQDKTRVYGDGNPNLTHSGLVSRDNSLAVRELDAFVDRQLQQDRFAHRVDLSTDATATSDVGSYGIDSRLSAGSFLSRRYEVQLGEARLVITPAPLVVRADDKSKMAGEQDPALTYQAEGWKFEQDKRDFSLARAPGEAAGNYRIYEQDGTRLVSANYQVTFIDGNLAIHGPVAPTPPAAAPTVGAGIPSQGNTSERCTPTESPASVVANHSATPAVMRSYSVQLVCKPRAYGSAEEQLPDKADLLNYANGLFKAGRFQLPDFNRSVIPRELQSQPKGGE
ncbi:MBG domain-containing protein [Pseudomonas sp. 2023EL-01195]|uniref:two-partner secretion domain-containing protein n=1 Tax=Pseudomonas sp. 2023EL-01195 TaxID=3088134 RepID=UPI00296AA4A5|nr:MBG domain-containing protein [Pseudomonas sp. 2023EL-01195]MDW3716589.1 MBG domain-containing protein [Pseudomonas sp. 2023EL-01195]